MLGVNAVYVSPNGHDNWPGTVGKPLASLQLAVEAARTQHAHRVIVLSGEYRLSNSLVLDSRDSGLMIEAMPGSRPLITGAIKVAKPMIQPTVLAGMGGFRITLPSEVNQPLTGYVPYGFPRPVVPGPSELFADGAPMTIARWPNTGYAKIQSVREPGNGEQDRNQPPRRPIFTLNSDRAKRWTSLDDAWIYGYWKFDWADETIKVHSIDKQSGEITLETPHTFGVAKDNPLFAENIREELDVPGEYFVSPSEHVVDFIAPSKPVKTYRISLLGQPLIHVRDADGITIRGIDLGFSRGDGAELERATNTKFEGCQFYNLGERGVVINDGHDDGLVGCNVWNTAHGGITLSGGDRQKLIPSRHFVENCDIHDYQRRAQTYRPGVSLNGVGNRVSHCAIHDAPHSAIIFGGNDHVIAQNEFYRTVSRTGDGGVLYTGRNWTARGTVINGNYFHDNVGLHQWEPAIYFDDLASGLTATNNLIERCHWAFMIGGGRDNVAENNLIIDCKEGFHNDARGLGWAKGSRPTMEQGLREVPYQGEIWRQRYPTLVDILTNDPMAPSRNRVQNNQLIRSGALLVDTEGPFLKGSIVQPNTVTQVGTSAGWKKSHVWGLIQDRIRKTLPPLKKD